MTDADPYLRASRLNEEALLALRMMTPEIITPLVRLLRSDVDLDRIVRTELADALERDEPVRGRIRLKLEGQATGRGAHMGARLERFQRDVKIARFVERAIEEDPARSVSNAIEKADEEYSVGVKTIEAARTKIKRMDAWISANMATKPRNLSFLSDRQWQSFREAKWRSVIDNDPPLEA